VIVTAEQAVFTLPVQFRPEARTFVALPMQDTLYGVDVAICGEVRVNSPIPMNYTAKTIAVLAAMTAIGYSRELNDYMWSEEE